MHTVEAWRYDRDKEVRRCRDVVEAERHVKARCCGGEDIYRGVHRGVENEI